MESMSKAEKDKIIFDKDYFNRAFVSHSIVLNKAFSSLSLRLMSVLLQNLSFYKARKLPPRTILAKKLGVSVTAINNSLYELEQAEFLIRYIYKDLEKMTVVDESKNDQQEFLAKTEKQKKVNRGSKSFSDYFELNVNYNKTEEDIDKEIYKSLREHLDPNLTNEELKNLLDSLFDNEKPKNILIDMFNEERKKNN